MTERAQGDFQRQRFLGESLDGEHITATHEDGVLTVAIPVAEQAKPQRVKVTHVGSVVRAVETVSTGA